CKRYAEILKKSRPRLATSFEYATIEDGILKVVVPNDILKDEINTNLHSIVSELMQLCNSGNIIIDIVVDQSLEQVKTILLKDEDKLKFLTTENSSLSKFCTALNLDFV
ncbi:MAG: hypothetical protein RR277_06870, partial [Rikenellaceae bacterium]